MWDKAVDRRLFLKIAACAPTALAVRGYAADKMSYLTSSQHASLTADPSYISTIYAAERSRFLSDLGSSFAAEIEENIKFGFCGLVSYDHAPYGACTTIDLDAMLNSAVLDCDNYVALTWKLFLILVPSPTITISVVGVDHGPVGNHAFLSTFKQADANGNGGGYWIVDPTIGAMNCGHGIDAIMSGKPVNMAYAKSFLWRDDPNIIAFSANCLDAWQSGKHRPSNILYWTKNISKFLTPAVETAWMTPASE